MDIDGQVFTLYFPNEARKGVTTGQIMPLTQIPHKEASPAALLGSTLEPQRQKTVASLTIRLPWNAKFPFLPTDMCLNLTVCPEPVFRLHSPNIYANDFTV